MTLFVSDLDGTLLNDQAELSPYSRDLLTSMLAEGLLFTVASARSVSSIRSMLKGLPLQLPVIEFNGAFISDLHTGRHDYVNAIHGDIVSDVYHLLSQGEHPPFVASFNGDEDCLYPPTLVNPGAQWYYDDRVTRRDARLRASHDIHSSLKEQIVCLTSIGKEAELQRLADEISRQYGQHLELHLFENQYSPGWHWLTAHDRLATKDQAIRTLVESCGLSSHELVVFGDHINDLKMFSVADESIAVENAVPLVKSAASKVIGKNSEDSVVKYIRDRSVAQTL